MTEGSIVKWLKRDGDTVAAGEDVYELEYDKAVVSIQAKKSGVIKILHEEGATIPVGDAVGFILEDGESYEDVAAKPVYRAAQIQDIGALKASTTGKLPVAGVSIKDTTAIKAAPMVRRLAKEMGIDIVKVTASDPQKGIRKEDLEAYAASRKVNQTGEHNGSSVRISPLARKLATEMGVNIAAIQPADGNRITKEDVLAYQKSQSESAGATASGNREKLSGMRKVIAQRMAQSYFTYPVVTLTTDTDMTALLQRRKVLNKAQKNIKLSVTDMLVKAVALALRENAIVNASLMDNEIVYHDRINIGIAVALDNGLVVPVVKDVDKRTLEEIAQETGRLVTLAKQGQLKKEDISKGTFTITNLGTYGIDTFTPIINQPESAILGVGRTVEKPVVIDGKVAISKRMALSLTHDHRIIDGAPAAKFLQSVVGHIQQPIFN